MKTFAPDPIASAVARLDETMARKKNTLPSPDERARLRREAGLTRAELAEIIGVSTSALYAWEKKAAAPRNGRGQVYAAVLERLAEVSA